MITILEMEEIKDLIEDAIKAERIRIASKIRDLWISSSCLPKDNSDYSDERYISKEDMEIFKFAIATVIAEDDNE